MIGSDDNATVVPAARPSITTTFVAGDRTTSPCGAGFGAGAGFAAARRGAGVGRRGLGWLGAEDVVAHRDDSRHDEPPQQHQDHCAKQEDDSNRHEAVSPRPDRKISVVEATSMRSPSRSAARPDRAGR